MKGVTALLRHCASTQTKPLGAWRVANLCWATGEDFS
jgi:hypothetical protein